MLKKLTNNKKGFSLVEILVAVSILGIIVGPLLASLYRNNYVIEQARKETEATYVAKKVMEETMAEYYYSVSGDLDDTTDSVTGYPTYIGKLAALLDKSSTGNSYTSTDGYKSKYADKFTYDIKIVPSGKNGLGISDNTANYLHVYTDKVNGMDSVYVVFPNGEVKKIDPQSPSANNPLNILDMKYDEDNSACSVDLNKNPIRDDRDELKRPISSKLNSSKHAFRIVCYSSADASPFQYYFTASDSWPYSMERHLANHTSVGTANQVAVTIDHPDFIDESNFENYYSSSREQWDVALYEITVSVYDENGKVLSSAESVIEVKIFPDIKK